MPKTARVQWLNRDLVIGPRFTLVLSQAEMDAAMKDLNHPYLPYLNPGAPATTTHFSSSSGEATSIVGLSLAEALARNGTEIAGILVHEAVHIWQDWCAMYGEKAPSSEFEAYAIQSISQRLMEEYVRKVSAPEIAAL